MGILGESRLFAGLAERRYARQASKQLLELFHATQREHPELSGRPLYQAVIARRLGANRTRAAEIVRRAEESFTDWPVERELRFRHVVHYLIFEEYTHTGAAREATRINMGGAIARVVPEEI